MKQWEKIAEGFQKGTIVDLSPTLENGIPKWPTHPPVVIDGRIITHEHDGSYCQILNMGEHSGAHVDVPAHVIPELMDRTVETFPGDMVCGPAIKYDLYKLGAKPGERISKEAILSLEEEMGDAAKEGDIVLLNYGWQQYWTNTGAWKYFACNEPGLSEEVCEMFAQRKVKAVGSDTIACDTPQVDGVALPAYGHEKYWLPNNIFIMEMIMNMDKLPTRSFFMAIPLKIKNGSGSPIRPLAIID
ncbi:MAG: cyclase family protein [Lachnospiraceae bacterium]|nr:cyclase family protein [Lachnospiraceae bacterium]MDD3617007.1 cyclase family protein [Lachnospiraceae bacterium]